MLVPTTGDKHVLPKFVMVNLAKTLSGTKLSNRNKKLINNIYQFRG